MFFRFGFAASSDSVIRTKVGCGVESPLVGLLWWLTLERGLGEQKKETGDGTRDRTRQSLPARNRETWQGSPFRNGLKFS